RLALLRPVLGALAQHEVEDDPDDDGGDDTGAQERDELVGQDGDGLGDESQALADGEGDGDDDEQALVQTGLPEELDPDGEDVAEEQDGRAAEDRGRHRGDRRSALGEEAEQDEDRAGGGGDVPAQDPGERDQPGVLAVGGARHGAEEAGEEGTDARARDHAGVLACRRLAVGRPLGDGDHGAHRVEHVDQPGDAHGDHRGGLERHAELQRDRHGHPGGVGHRLPVDHPERDGDDVPDGEGEEDGGGAEEAAAVVAQRDRQGEDQGREREVPGAAEVRAPGTAGGHLDARGDEAEPHAGQDDAQDHRGEEEHEAGDDEAREELHHTGDQRPAEDGGQPVLHGHGEGDRREDEAAAVDDGQAGADGSEPDTLDDGRQARDEDGDLDERRRLGGVGADEAGEDDRDGDVAGEHRQHV